MENSVVDFYIKNRKIIIISMVSLFLIYKLFYHLGELFYKELHY